MKDYSAMSDFDIQQEVLQETWGKHPVRLLGKMMLDIMLSDYDPCNNPADAWPIILSERISIEHDGDCWRSDLFNENGGYEAESDSPLRAAMTAYLMMKDAEKSHG